MVQEKHSPDQEVDYTSPKEVFNNLCFSNELEIPIEEILGSKGRVKILKLLAVEGELNISKIVQNTHLNHASARDHLNRFVKAGLLEKKKFGRIRIYRLRIEDLRVRAIKRLFDIWENPNL